MTALSTLRTEVRTHVGTDIYDQAAADTELTVLINAAVRSVVLDNPTGWPWLRREVALSTASGVDLYDLAHTGTHPISSTYDIDKVVSIRATIASTTIMLERTHYAALIDNFALDAPLGLPRAWAPAGPQIKVGPQPDGVYALKVLCVVAEPDLVDPSDEPLVPHEFRSLIVYKAAEALSVRMQNARNAQWFAQTYQRELQKAKAYARTVVGPSRVVDTDTIMTSSAP